VRVAPETQTFEARPQSSRDARRFVEHWLDSAGLTKFADRIPLAISELAANAVLHTARPFTISIRGDGDCVRLEAVDSAPDLVPVASALHGIASDITGLSETGRGLLIAASLANRWGIDLSSTVKTIWCEFDGSGPPAVTTEPVIDDQRPSRTPVAGLNHLRFLELPVRTAIASGLDVEDAIRELRVQSESTRTSRPDDLTMLLDLVERSVTVRLAGRHAAMHAASEGHYRFDMTMDVTDDALFATGDLSKLLARRAGRRDGPSAEIVEFRVWLGNETSRQRKGLPPTPCPLSADL
jgi:anti-sigma regulatory factor (Ser/Thr protein kinase)